jgi:hypothetical protein
VWFQLAKMRLTSANTSDGLSFDARRAGHEQANPLAAGENRRAAHTFLPS